MIRLAAIIGAVVAIVVPTSAARAASPVVTVDRTAASIGQTVNVTVTDFPVGRAVTVTICGNEARRGSIDCDLPGSVAFPINRFDKAHVTSFPVGKPPAPCPCVIKASNTPGDDVAFAPIVINGFPTAAVVDSELSQPLALDVQITRASQNPLAWLRSSLGGPTAYDVRVALHNQTSGAVASVKLTVRAGRNATDQSRRVVLDAPRTLAAGQTWRGTERVTLSAPVVGDFSWTLTASGDGALARSTSTTEHQPLGLYLLVVVLVGDIGWIMNRHIRKRRRPAETPTVPSVIDLRVPPAVLDLRSDRVPSSGG